WVILTFFLSSATGGFPSTLIVPLIFGALGSAGSADLGAAALAAKTAAPIVRTPTARNRIAFLDLTLSPPMSAARRVQARLLEPLRERAMLLVHRRGQVIPELVEELLLAAQRIAPALDVDLEESLALGGAESGALQIQRAARGDHSDGRLHRV